MRILKLFLVYINIVFSCSISGQHADYIFVDANIYTADDSQSFYSAIAIKDSVILKLGNDSVLQSLIGPATNVVSLEGKTILPGIHDVHMHPLEASAPLFGNCQLDPWHSIDQLISTLSNCNLTPNSNGWILAFGHSIFSLLDSPIPSKEYLDELFPDIPVLIFEETSHSMWVNSKALSLAGINSNTPDPIGGHIYRHWSGEVDGILMDNAGDKVLQIALAPNEEISSLQYQGLIEYGLPLLAKNGITSICEGRTYYKQNFIQTWNKIKSENKLTCRVALAPWIYPDDDFNAQVNAIKSMYDTGDNFLSIRQVKCYSDGITINATASLHEPYLDNLGLPFNSGLNYLSSPLLTDYIVELGSAGFDFHIHAIGDKGISDALDAIDLANNSGTSINLARHRMTHLEIVNPSDYGRFKELGVLADMQVSADWTQPKSWSENIPFLGAERAMNFIPLKSIFDTGALVTLSSDWDVSTVNPFVGIEHAVTREPQALSSVQDAVDAYTINGAYTMRYEDITGSLEEGKLADFIIIDRDIFSIAKEEISKTKVLSTWINGEEIYNNINFVSSTSTYNMVQNLFQIKQNVTDLSCTLEFNNNDLRSIELRSFDGEIIKTYNPINRTNLIINTAKLPAGTYLVIGESKNNSIQQEKLIVVH